MGTRGLVGFKVDNKVMMQYQQFDSYPTGVGVTTLKFVRLALDGRDAFANRVRKLRVVNEDVPPTPEEQEALLKYANLGVSTQSTYEWYVLLRETQGDIGAILESGYIISDNDEKGLPRFGYDSLFCEWAYLVDFDANCVDVYKGFQKSRPIAGLWVEHDQTDDSGYHPINKIDSIPFSLIAVLSDEDIEVWAKRTEGES
jgi:hypothetical protein